MQKICFALNLNNIGLNKLGIIILRYVVHQKKENKMGKNLKEGISVQELEKFGQKYYIEIFFVIYFLLATLLTFLFFGAAWSILLGGIGGIVGILLPTQIEKIARAAFRFVFKQEKTTKLILAIVGIILSFFLPPIIFLFLGLVGGFGMYKLATMKERRGTKREEEKEQKEEN